MTVFLERDGGTMKFCTCHNEEMRWFKDATRTGGGRWRCAVKRRESNRRGAAAQLARGEQIPARQNHHDGMAELKAQRGDPRPSGLTLFLVNPDSPSAYWGYAYNYKKERVPYRLSTAPNDYVWETLLERNRRTKELA